MLPPLTSEGVLPPGVDRASLAEVVGRFGMGARRQVEVTERLRWVLELAGRTGQLRRGFIWGSYITNKIAPNDVDLMLVMAADFRWELCGLEAQRVFDCTLPEQELGATVMWV